MPMQSKRFRILWETPLEDEGLSGYYIYRKTSVDPEWKRVKILGANKNDYTDNSANAEGVWYAYKVIAYYQDMDCMSAPAKAKYGNEYFINICSPTSVDAIDAQQVGIYPNPADDKVVIEASTIKNVTVFNLMGQKVYESSVDADKVELNTSDLESGMYMIQIETSEYTTTKRISVAH